MIPADDALEVRRACGVYRVPPGRPVRRRTPDAAMRLAAYELRRFARRNDQVMVRPPALSWRFDPMTGWHEAWAESYVVADHPSLPDGFQLPDVRPRVYVQRETEP